MAQLSGFQEILCKVPREGQLNSPTVCDIGDHNYYQHDKIFIKVQHYSLISQRQATTDQMDLGLT